jgi:hypothetical protein
MGLQSGCHRSYAALWLLIALWLSGATPDVGDAQELSTEVFPSEDELLQALYTGEIGYTHYVILREIAQHGLDSTNSFLLDEIPNLAWFQTDSLAIRGVLQTDQKLPFTKARRESTGKIGTVIYRHYQMLQEEDQSRYRLSANLRLADNWQSSFKIHREYTGNERLVSRVISYDGRTGFLRKLKVGSYVARLGLGTVFGYRGKLFDYSGRLDGETLLFPDFGGFNGVYARATTGSLQYQGLGSYSRDSSHSLLSVGVMASDNCGRFRPGLILGVNRLSHRFNRGSLWDLKAGLHSHLEYNGGYNGSELTAQTGANRFAVALLTEGRHRFELAEIRYAGWVYGDRFLDLTSGSKAGGISHYTDLEEVDFRFNGRRAGQEGLLFKTIVQLANDWKLSNGVILAVRNSDTVNIELLSSVSRRLTPSVTTRLDYLARERKRCGLDGAARDRDQRARLECRIKSGNLSIRTYIAYTVDRAEGDYVALFGALKCQVSGFGKVEVWSNLGRIRDGDVEYWYMYLRNEQVLSNNLFFAVKLADTFRGDRYDKNEPVVSFELRARI